MPVRIPVPAEAAQETARDRAAASRIDDPELRVTETLPPEMAMPTAPDGF